MTTASQMPPEPADPAALFALAEREHRAGRLAEAVTAYRKILALRPDAAEIYNNLGNVLADQGQLDEAAAQYLQAVAFRPSFFQAYNHLGIVLRRQGKLDEATARLEQAIALAPDYADAHNNLGNVFWDRGKLDQARAQYQQALALKPDLAVAHNNLGNIDREQGRLDEAAARYERAVTLRADYAEARCNLANILRSQGKLEEAAAELGQAVAQAPDLVAAEINPARRGPATALGSELADAHNNLGTALKNQGRFEEAVAHYARALAFRADHAGAHYNRADLKTFRPEDPDLAALEAIAADPHGLRPSEMLHVHFALGKALEDVGEYRRAFEQFLQGNALKRREVSYNEAALQRTFQNIVERFDTDLRERFAGAGDPATAPIFIVGMPRSGSTLVEQILASHPQVIAAGELADLDRLANRVMGAEGRVDLFAPSIAPRGADGWRRLGQEYLAGLPELPEGKRRITDKAPGNFLHIGLIRLMLPNARIIHTMRDPVDTCVSCFSILFSQGQPFSYNLAELGCYYRWYYELMDHWRSVLPAGAMLDVVYEEVVGDLEGQARRLVDYCGLPWDDRCLNFHQTKRAIRTASNVQVRQPVYRSSVERWRRYEAFLEPLLVELQGCRA